MPNGLGFGAIGVTANDRIQNIAVLPPDYLWWLRATKNLAAKRPPNSSSLSTILT
jgi:hypothetical protein